MWVPGTRKAGTCSAIHRKWVPRPSVPWAPADPVGLETRCGAGSASASKGANSNTEDLQETEQEMGLWCLISKAYIDKEMPRHSVIFKLILDLSVSTKFFTWMDSWETLHQKTKKIPLQKPCGLLKNFKVTEGIFLLSMWKVVLGVLGPSCKM